MTGGGRNDALQRLIEKCRSEQVFKHSSAIPDVVNGVTLNESIFERPYGKDRVETVCTPVDVKIVHVDTDSVLAIYPGLQHAIDTAALKNAVISAREQFEQLSIQSGLDRTASNSILQLVSRASRRFGAVVESMLDRNKSLDVMTKRLAVQRFDTLYKELEGVHADVLSAFSELLATSVAEDSPDSDALYEKTADIVYEQAEQYIVESLGLEDTTVVLSEQQTPSLPSEAIVLKGKGKPKAKAKPVVFASQPSSQPTLPSILRKRQQKGTVSTSVTDATASIDIARKILRQHSEILSAPVVEVGRNSSEKAAIEARQSDLESAQSFLDYFERRVRRAVQDPETLTKIVTFVVAAVLQTAAAQFMWYQYGRRAEQARAKLEQLLTTSEMKHVDSITKQVLEDIKKSDDPMHYFKQLKESGDISAMEEKQLNAYKVALFVASAYSEWWSGLPVEDFEHKNWIGSWLTVLSESITLLKQGKNPSQKAVEAYATAVLPHLPQSNWNDLVQYARQIAFTNMMNLPTALLRSMRYRDMLTQLVEHHQNPVPAPHAFAFIEKKVVDAVSKMQTQKFEELTTPTSSEDLDELEEIDEDINNSVFMRYMSSSIGNPFVTALLKNLLGSTFRAASWEVRQLFRLESWTQWMAAEGGILSALLSGLVNTSSALFELATLNHMNLTLATAVGSFVGGAAEDYYNSILDTMDKAAAQTASNMSSTGGTGWRLWAKSLRFMGRLVRRSSDRVALVNNRLIGWTTMWNGLMLVTGITVLYHSSLTSGALALGFSALSRSLTRVACMVALESVAFIAVRKLTHWSRAINDILPKEKRYVLIEPLTLVTATTVSSILLVMFRNSLLKTPTLNEELFGVSDSSSLLANLEYKYDVEIDYDIWLEKRRVLKDLLATTTTHLQIPENAWYLNLWEMFHI